MTTYEISRDHEVVHQARAVLTKHAKSFSWASVFLPKDRADDAAIIYSFCRMVDDAVDEAETPQKALENIDAIKSEISSNIPKRVEVSSFLDVCERLHIPVETAYDLIDGVYGDLGKVRVKDKRELGVYCYKVAGVVGRMMCGVLGVSSSHATPFAIDLGIGMQITNICRDVQEDARRDRIYIPEDLLQEYNISSESIILENPNAEQVKRLIDHMLSLAETSYTRARIGMRFIPFKTRVAILVASRIYRSIGLKLQKTHQSNPFHGRTIVSTSGKLLQVFLGLIDAFHPVTLGWMTPQIPQSPFYEEWTELSTMQTTQKIRK